PEPARTHARKGADLLVNLTNDAWFGRTSAPYQHLAMTVFRAVETGRPLVRAANTGFSALVDPSGKILARTGLFQEALLVGEVTPGSREPTIYTRLGDLLLLPVLLLAATGLYAARKRLSNE
ncbi:MAG: apolipoprotein N-acyltransferase, partial [Deltaproteobacteria bacterium]